MTMTNELIWKTAKTYEGTWEWAGAENNPVVVEMYAMSGHPEIKQDSVPWCAAYVGAVLAECGLPTTASLLARSYLKWGRKVANLRDAQQGDVIVLKRGSKSWQGHVGFVDRVEGRTVYILGGNQNDQVNIKPFSVDDVLGVRRAETPRKEAAKRPETVLGAGTLAGGGTAAAAVLPGLSPTAQLVLIGAAVVLGAAVLYLLRDDLRQLLLGRRS